MSDEPHLYASNIKDASILPCYNRAGGAGSIYHPDYVAPEPLIIPQGYRVTIEVTDEGIFTVRREKL